MTASKYLRTAARAAGTVERTVARVTAPGRNVGFPLRAPTVPGGVEVPDAPPSLGADYDTRWARTPVARVAREVLMSGPVRLGVKALTDPEIRGHDRLDDLLRSARDDDPPAVIFAPNHHSHLDTGLMVRSVPAAWRRRLVTAAAADYFFDKRWKATLSALALNAVPVDRESTGRKSADQMADLIERGWSLVIYPEGGRSPDGWGQSFKGGAAYLSGRTGAPVVPVFIDGTDSIMGKGMNVPKPGRTRVTFGRPIVAVPGESTRRLNERIERAVAELADESTTDFWTARRRAATGTTPTLAGPAYTGWRRKWDLAKRRKHGIAAWRRPPQRRWPDLG
jgi:1-acyl-sn-glycerol-3-phosphate acyltransferase